MSDVNEKSWKKDPEIRNCVFWRDLMLHALIFQGTLWPVILLKFWMIDPAMDKMKASLSHVSLTKDILYYEDGRREFSKMLENLNVAY